MDTIVLFGTNTGAVGNTTSYYAPGNFGNTYNSVSVITGRSVVPVPATLRNLYVDIDGTPTAGTSRIFTLYKNGVATAMTITLGEGVSTGSDTTHTVDVVAGDLISLEVKVTGTPPSLTNLRAGLVADCGTGVSFVNGTPGVNTPTAATGYMPVQGTPGGTFPTTAA